MTYPCIFKVLEVRFKSSNYALTPTFWHLINVYCTIILCLLIWNVIPSCSYFNSFPAETSFTHFAQLGNFAKRGRDWPAWPSSARPSAVHFGTREFVRQNPKGAFVFGAGRRTGESRDRRDGQSQRRDRDRQEKLLRRRTEFLRLCNK